MPIISANILPHNAKKFLLPISSPELRVKQLGQNLLTSQTDRLSYSDTHFEITLRNQVKYAQFFKFIVLFTIVMENTTHLKSFLMFYSCSGILNNSPFLPSFLHGYINILDEYYRNLWISTISFGASIAITSFLLFSPVEKVYRGSLYILWHTIDLLSFLAIILLLIGRLFLANRVEISFTKFFIYGQGTEWSRSMKSVLMCSFNRVPVFPEMVLGTIFPILILKFLITLAIVTFAYLLLVYILAWCIKHWMPHKSENHAHHLITQC